MRVYPVKPLRKKNVTIVKTIRIVTIVKTNHNNSDTSVFHQRPFRNQDQPKQQ